MLTQVAKKATEASSEKKWEFPVFEIRNRNENIFVREMKRSDSVADSTLRVLVPGGLGRLVSVLEIAIAGARKRFKALYRVGVVLPYQEGVGCNLRGS